MRSYLTLFFLFALFITPVFAQDDDLQSTLEQVVAPEDNGVVVLVRAGDDTFIAEAGLADLEKGTPIKATDAFRIASVTKTFVATVMLQLQEENVLSLDDPILQWLPQPEAAEIPYAEDIHIRELLNMTSGIFNYVESDAFYDATMESRAWKAEEIIPYILDGEPDFAPGESYYYSNSNYILAQLIIENATGNTLSEELQKRIFKPLGMTHTFLENPNEVGKGIIQGYGDEDGDGTLENVTNYNDGLGLGDGGIVSTVEDLALFADELIISHSLLSEESWHQMTDMVDDGEGGSYGLALYPYEIGDATFLGHDGASSGFLTQMWVDVDDDITIVMFTNNFDSEVFEGSFEEVASWVLDQQ